jgi:hypothetical protein
LHNVSARAALYDSVVSSLTVLSFQALTSPGRLAPRVAGTPQLARATGRGQSVVYLSSTGDTYWIQMLRYPNLPFVVPHFGAGYFREALMLADLCPNVYLDTASSNSWIKYEGLELKTVFRRALDVVGPGRLLFGTDSSF